ncbi:MAG TPA: phage tail protein, partial [Planctomycetota bacterium]|nr:phage tail protein [Planctomycetota bacterium]
QTVTLLESEIPAHSHMMGAQNTPLGGISTPGNSATINRPASGKLFDTNLQVAPMSPSTLSLTGADTGHNNMQPFLTLNFCIALQGVFPPRP